MIRIFSVIAVLIFSSWAAFAFERVDHVTYYGTTDEECKVSWDHNSPRPDRYEVRLYHVERESDAPAGIGETQENSLTFRLPQSGHFVAKVRACVDSADAGYSCDVLPCCSDWSESINPEVATVDGEPRGWWLYGYVAPPGAIIINSYEGP